MFVLIATLVVFTLILSVSVLILELEIISIIELCRSVDKLADESDEADAIVTNHSMKSEGDDDGRN